MEFQIKQLNKGVFISQIKHARNIVKKFGFEKASIKHTSTLAHSKLSKDTEGTNVDESLYISIATLLYLTVNRPTIARYQLHPKTSHLLSDKRIIKYINGTSDHELLYTFDISSSLVGYCGADWAGSFGDRKSSSRGYYFLRNNLISLFSKIQNCVSLSTAKVEYIAAGSSYTQLMWTKQMLSEYMMFHKKL